MDVTKSELRPPDSPSAGSSKIHRWYRDVCADRQWRCGLRTLLTFINVVQVVIAIGVATFVWYRAANHNARMLARAVSMRTSQELSHTITDRVFYLPAEFISNMRMHVQYKYSTLLTGGTVSAMPIVPHAFAQWVKQAPSGLEVLSYGNENGGIFACGLPAVGTRGSVQVAVPVFVYRDDAPHANVSVSAMVLNGAVVEDLNVFAAHLSPNDTLQSLHAEGKLIHVQDAPDYDYRLEPFYQQIKAQPIDRLQIDRTAVSGTLNSIEYQGFVVAVSAITPDGTFAGGIGAWSALSKSDLCRVDVGANGVVIVFEAQGHDSFRVISVCYAGTARSGFGFSTVFTTDHPDFFLRHAAEQGKQLRSAHDAHNDSSSDYPQVRDHATSSTEATELTAAATRYIVSSVLVGGKLNGYNYVLTTFICVDDFLGDTDSILGEAVLYSSIAGGSTLVLTLCVLWCAVSSMKQVADTMTQVLRIYHDQHSDVDEGSDVHAHGGSAKHVGVDNATDASAAAAARSHLKRSPSSIRQRNRSIHRQKSTRIMGGAAATHPQLLQVLAQFNDSTPRSPMITALRSRFGYEAQDMVDALRKMLLELCESQKQSEEAQAAKSHFIRYIFHELRVPFNAMVLCVKELQDIWQGLEDNDTSPLVSLLDDQCSVLTQILNDVLSLQKMEERAFRLEYTPMSVWHMVSQTARTFDAALSAKQLTAHVRVQCLSTWVTKRQRVYRQESYPRHSPQLGGPRSSLEYCGASSRARETLAALPLSSPSSSLSSIHKGGVSVSNMKAGPSDDNMQVDPSEAESHATVGDKYRIRQVMSNLLSNAIKFSTAGCNIYINVGFDLESAEDAASDSAKIKMNLSPDAEASADSAYPPVTAHFSVRDEGVGIAPEHQLRLFEPFKQFNATQLQQGGGTGLGLSLSKGLVELHGGSIGCHSVLGQGADFYFDLPFNVVQCTTPLELVNSPRSGPGTSMSPARTSAGSTLSSSAPSPRAEFFRDVRHRCAGRLLRGSGTAADQSSPSSQSLPLRVDGRPSPQRSRNRTISIKRFYNSNQLTLPLGNGASTTADALAVPEVSVSAESISKVQAKRGTLMLSRERLHARSLQDTVTLLQEETLSTRVTTPSNPNAGAFNAAAGDNITSTGLMEVTVTSSRASSETSVDADTHASCAGDHHRLEMLSAAVHSLVQTAAPQATGGVSDPVSSASKRPKQPRILFAEDSVPTRKLLCAYLRRNGFEVVDVEDGVQALAAVLKSEHVSAEDLTTVPEAKNVKCNFDLVITDGHMPNMSGEQLTRELRQRGMTVPVLALTGNALQEDQDSFLRQGANYILTKPVDREHLLEIVRRLVRAPQS